jgi:iron complex outermembrane receptor protein
MSGLGALLDLTRGATGAVLGMRYDWVQLHSRIPDFVLTNPGLEARGHDDGFSWSLSVSREILQGVRPYATYSRQETLVHGIDGGVGISVVPDALNTSELREIGVKSSLLDNKLFLALSGYRQTRTSFTADTQQVPASLSHGLEFEARWVPSERLSLAGGGNWQKTRYDPVRTGPLIVSPSYFGLGNDYYGGRLQVTLGKDSPYDERTGYPDIVLNLNATWFFNKALALNVSSIYQGEAASGRLRDITLPDAAIVDLALIYDTPRWGARVAVSNLTNALYFVPNSPDFTGEVIVIPAPERSFQTSFTFKF